MLRTAIIATAILGFGNIAAADCASDADVAQFVADYVAGTPAKALVPDGTMEDALCTQAKVAKGLRDHVGTVIGYKAGLTSRPAQERFGVTEPVQGVLFRNMMLPDGAEVPANWGARPVFEADLILVVGTGVINGATTAKQAMPYISAVRPFIELPDLTFADGEPINAVTLTAIGVGSKLGILGAAIPVRDPAEMYNALGLMQVTLSAADGEVLAQAPGEAVMGHPVNSLIWLMSKGITLKPGDMVSVGSFGPLFPPGKGKGGASVQYKGLPGDPTVSVVFR